MKMFLMLIIIATGFNFHLLGSTLDIGLVARYTFENNALDQSGNGRNGVTSNINYGPDRFTNSSGSALYMNNQNGRTYVDVKNIFTDQSIQQNFTFSIWLKPTDYSSHSEQAYNIFMGYITDNPANRRPVLRLHNDNSMSYSSYLGVVARTPSSKIIHNDWNQVVFRGDNSTKEMVIDIFNVNGQSTTLFNFGLSDTLWPTSSEINPNIIIGADISAQLNDQWNIDYHQNLIFTGAMDDIRIYNRTLSNVEVLSLNAAESVPEPSALSLLAVGLGVLFRRSRKRD